MRNVSRRRFVTGSLAGAACTALRPLLKIAKVHAYEAKDIPFFDQYYYGVLDILTGIRDTQLDLIKREMKTAYERSKKGGTIYSQITAGHFPTTETALDRTGNPGVFAFLERNANGLWGGFCCS